MKLLIFSDIDGTFMNHDNYSYSHLKNYVLKIKNNSLIVFDINLITTDEWFDIFSRKKININDSELYFHPYQTIWITNKKY